jgi:hypothetical protein
LFCDLRELRFAALSLSPLVSDLLADRYVRRGMSQEEARAMARREFGGSRR